MYIYFLGGLICFIVWILLFYFRKDTRKEMVLISVLMMFATFSEPFFVPEYWSPKTLLGFPKLSIEDFIFCFSTGGIGAVIYEEILGKKLRSKRKSRINPKVLFLGAGPVLMFFFYFVFGFKFMTSALIGMFLDSIIIILTRKDLTEDLLMSGLLFMLLYFIIFQFFLMIHPEMIQMWNLKNLSGFFILGIPIEEILWAFLAGAVSGPLYEFMLDLRISNLKKKVIKRR